MAQLVRCSPCWLVNSLVDFFRVEEDPTTASTSSLLPAYSRQQPGVGGPPGGQRQPSSRAIVGRSNSLRASGFTKIQTLSGEFKSQLEELMENINTTSPHYIRYTLVPVCIYMAAPCGVCCSDMTYGHKRVWL